MKSEKQIKDNNREREEGRETKRENGKERRAARRRLGGGAHSNEQVVGGEKVKPVSVGVVGTNPVLRGQMCGRAASQLQPAPSPPAWTLLPKPTSLCSKTHSFIRLCSLLFLDLIRNRLPPQSHSPISSSRSLLSQVLMFLSWSVGFIRESRCVTEACEEQDVVAQIFVVCSQEPCLTAAWIRQADFSSSAQRPTFQPNPSGNKQREGGKLKISG